MKIIVIGGRGHLGVRTVAALRALPGVEVLVASRRASGPGELRVDLTRPETFTSLEGADIVVDLADPATAPPDAVAAFCLERGLTLIETTADAPVVERLHRAFAVRPAARGALVLGAGIFTGLSNLLAHAVARRVPACTDLELGIRTGPFSGAGRSTVDLMGALLATGAVSYADGARVDGPPVAPGPRLPFATGEHATLRCALAEPYMLRASTGVGSVRAAMALRPAFVRALFLLLPLAVVRSAWFRWIVRVQFTLVRRLLLAGRATAVELVAVARNAAGARARGTITSRDGMRAGGAAIAVIAVQLAERAERLRGVHFVDALVGVEETCARINALPGAAHHVALALDGA